MKILMVSSEASPFAKTGGLADAVSALSKTFSAMGHTVKVLIPRYYNIDRANLQLEKADVPVNNGWQDVNVSFYKKKENNNLTFYFVDYEPLFGRDGIYGDKIELDFHDNPLRFSLLARSAFALCRTLKFTPDVIHCHDWAACITPLLLKFYEHRDFPKTKSVLSIHNQGYQGKFSRQSFDMLGLPERVRVISGLDDYDCINFLKAGITCSDKISTVSETYAKEIQTPEQGFGLDGLLRVRSSDLTGIINGADLTEWNPAVDKYIPAKYSIKNMKGKAECKRALQEKFGLELNPDIPVIGMVGRLAFQKGINELFAQNYGCMERICRSLNVQVVLVGSGERWCEDEIRRLSASLTNFKAFAGYSEQMSHLVEAGSDFFLMPSRYEPCGLNQIYSMLYGTLPIVHSTGGLADTVINYNPATGEGSGFVFNDLTPDAIFNTVNWAINVYLYKPVLNRLRHTAMQKDFSWTNSANKYIQMYKSMEDNNEC